MTAEIATFLKRDIKAYRKSSHSSGALLLRRPFQCRTDEQLDQLRHDDSVLGEYASAFDLQSDEIADLKEIRKRIDVDAIVFIGLRDESENPFILQSETKGGRARKRAETALNCVLQWPATEFRRAIKIGCDVSGQGPKGKAATISFPSRAFPGLPHDELHNVVISLLPNQCNAPPMFTPIVAFVNCGKAFEDNESVKASKTQYELAAYTLGCVVRKNVEERLTFFRDLLNRTPFESELELTLLLEEASRSSLTGVPMGKMWSDKFCALFIDLLTKRVERFTSSYGAPDDLIDIKRWLSNNVDWIKGATWIDSLLGDVAVKSLTELADVSQVCLEVFADPEAREAINLERISVDGVDSDIAILLASVLKKQFRRQSKVTVVVSEVHPDGVEVEIKKRGHESFSATLAPHSFPEVEPGDTLETDLWDLWSHWYGFVNLRPTKTTTSKWTTARKKRVTAKMDAIDEPKPQKTLKR